jgi:single-strand DNA-binding protein
MSYDNLTLTGFVATPPKSIATREGVSIASFRLASNQRRFDRLTGKWVDGDTNWYTITAFRQLAGNVISSINRGDRVVVSGRLKLRNWQNGDRSGTTAEVEADSIGHDLTFGFSRFTRTILARTADEAVAAADTEGSTERERGALAPPTDELKGPDSMDAPDSLDAPDSIGEAAGSGSTSAGNVQSLFPVEEAEAVPF